jgi:bifunctional DNA-binding transcriptional regulator/antitoxin component of YhaV-PrlF toxin-antitoxin module
MSLVKIQKKGQLTLPSRVWSRLGLCEGDLADVKVRAANIVITRQMVVDRSKFPNADDEYTPRQRCIIDAQLAKSEGDFKKGRTFGPFDTAAEMVASMKEQLKKRAAAKKAKPSR